jgi:hypothetical protein
LKKSKRTVSKSQVSKKTVSAKKSRVQKIKTFGKKKLAKPSRLIKRSKAIVDDILLKLSPSVQNRIDRLSQTVESGTVSVSELKAIGLKVLQKAIDISRNLQKKSTADKD